VGGGAVDKNPNQPSYDPGSQVTLTATPATGYTFTGWSGSITSTSNPVVVTMDGQKNVTATFTINTYTLALATSGNGSASSNPSQASYDHGTAVTLTATPATGWSFTGWTGDTTTASNPLGLVMTRNRGLTANFVIQSFPLSVATAGSGSVSKSPDQPSYTYGTPV